MTLRLRRSGTGLMAKGLSVPPLMMQAVAEVVRDRILRRLNRSV